MPIAALLGGDGTTPAPVYRVNTASKTGTLLVDLTSDPANVGPIEWELEGPGSASITIPTTAVSRSDVNPNESEIQIWREGRCLFWGPMIRPDADEKTVNFQCRGLRYYFDRRFFGKADRTNYLAGADFETMASWTTTGADSAASSTDRFKTGSKSAKLVEATAGADSFIYQNVSMTGTGVGTLLTLVGWFWLNDAGFVGGALDNRGLFVELEVGGSLYGEPSFTTIDAETPRNAWQRHETTIWIPPNLAVTVNVRLYAPAGTIYWDAALLVAMESVSFYATDQAVILAKWVDYAQDNFVFTHGKSDLNITATDATCPATGVLRDEHQQFADHANIGQSITAFASLDNGVDVSVEQDGINRRFHTYYPSKGTDRGGTPGAGVTTVTIDNTLLAAGPFGWRFDGDQAVSSVVILGDGDGPDREEGAATDTSVFGGTTYETVVASEPGTPIDRLDAKANEVLRSLINPESLTVTLHEPTVDLLGTVVVGDVVDVDIAHGYIQAAGDYRVVAIRFEPGKETLTFELNAV